MHDPLAVATLVWPELVEWQDLHVDVELDGAYAAGATLFRQPSASVPANVHVATSVDAPAFERLLIDRLCAP